ncbi:MAG: DNA adenine methylase [Spirochaetaceae bacterium]|nr:DNA adenine methylase [Spirochaetaceae bacterium]
MRYDSPLRYPGGKASLAGFLARTIELNNLSGCSYFEPFAGGAGAALRLLRDGVVSKLRLNDLDVRITAFWNSVLSERDRFVDSILSVPVSIAEWETQREICRRGDASNEFELGFATFYVNRCNRSGVLFRAAPIGGHEQAGEWKMDARFNRAALAERVIAISQRRESIKVTNMDARDFLVQHLPRGRERRRVFAYLDPPYHSNGSRLYLNRYRDRDHKELARYMQRQRMLNWVMSYDDVPRVRDLYASCTVGSLSIRYSFQRVTRTRELVIAPTHVHLPAAIERDNAPSVAARSA